MIVEYAAPAEGVGIIRLNRPERLNAVTPALVDGILDAFDRAAADQQRVLVLAGHGRAFCAGWDLKEPPLQESLDQARTRLQRLQDVTRRTIDFPGPVISAVQGYALGAGAEFALGCDLIVAGDDAVFGFPEIEVGLSSTNGITALLPRMIGLVRAKELTLLGERIDAGRAYELGLVTRVVPAGAHEQAALELAERLAAKPAAALRLAKRLLDDGMQSTVAAALEAEVEAALATLDTGENDTASARFRDR